MNSQAKTRGGFKVTGLLVVIAIISVLAAFLFPAFGRVRENASRSFCGDRAAATRGKFANGDTLRATFSQTDHCTVSSRTNCDS